MITPKNINFQKLWNQSSKNYQDYALKYSQYQISNNILIDFADVKENQIIVDLACWTWFTSKAILEKEPNIKQIYWVDFSENMLKVAKDFVNSNKVKFICSDVANIENEIFEKVNTFLCNAWFWQFEYKERILKSVYNLLVNNWKFCFNLPSQFFDFWDWNENKSPIIEKIKKEIQSRWYENSWKLVSKISKVDLENLFKNHWFKLEKFEILNIWDKSLEDLFEFFTIPATATFFENIPESEQKEILEIVYNKFKWKIVWFPNIWVYFSFSKSW